MRFYWERSHLSEKIYIHDRKRPRDDTRIATVYDDDLADRIVAMLNRDIEADAQERSDGDGPEQPADAG